MAELDLSDFVKSVRQTCDESELVTSYDVHILDNATVKIRVFLALEAFIDAYFNPENSNCAFALIRGKARIYGADNAFIGWHIHPFNAPDQHQPCEEVSFSDFLQVVEEWHRQICFPVKRKWRTTMPKQTIHTEEAPAAIGPYSQGAIANGFLFTAGQIALDPATGQIVEGDVAAQTRRVMDNLAAVLDAAGLTMADVAQSSVFLADLNDFGAFNEVYGSYFDDQPPARTTVEVARLPKGVRLEVAMIAAASQD